MSLQIIVSRNDVENNLKNNHALLFWLLIVRGADKYRIAASLFGHFQVVNGFTASNKLITSSPDPVNNAGNNQSR